MIDSLRKSFCKLVFVSSKMAECAKQLTFSRSTLHILGSRLSDYYYLMNIWNIQNKYEKVNTYQ